MTYQNLARRALRGAVETRKKAKIDLFSPLCVYDVAETLGVEVRFQGGDSFGGMYAKETQTILVPSERPTGRRTFTCGHELGHWYFKHGTKVEDLSEIDKGSPDDPNEILVDQFAGHLLMSKWAVEKAFKDRGLVIASASDREFYAIACQFGVGFESIITHLQYALALLTRSRAEVLLQRSPKQIKEELMKGPFRNHLVLVDSKWLPQIPIDLEVGDAAFCLFDANNEGRALDLTRIGNCSVFTAKKPGVSRVEATGGNWAAFVRVARKNFTGRSIYRHLEDPDEQ